MDSSILVSTKKILGLSEGYEAFDLDIITHINSALATLNQIGIGPTPLVLVEDEETIWEDLELPDTELSLVKTYIFLKVRKLFDPPTTSFLMNAMDEQISEYEWRLRTFKETELT
jgi:hypothetical protein